MNVHRVGWVGSLMTKKKFLIKTLALLLSLPVFSAIPLAQTTNSKSAETGAAPQLTLHRHQQGRRNRPPHPKIHLVVEAIDVSPNMEALFRKSLGG